MNQISSHAGVSRRNLLMRGLALAGAFALTTACNSVTAPAAAPTRAPVAPAASANKPTSAPVAVAASPAAVSGSPVAGPKVNANSASVTDLQRAFEAAGITNAARWAREVDEYRPYPTDDPGFAKLRRELAKYNPAPGVVDQIVATLAL